MNLLKKNYFPKFSFHVGLGGHLLCFLSRLVCFYSFIKEKRKKLFEKGEQKQLRGHVREIVFY